MLKWEENTNYESSEQANVAQHEAVCQGPMPHEYSVLMLGTKSHWNVRDH